MNTSSPVWAPWRRLREQLLFPRSRTSPSRSSTGSSAVTGWCVRTDWPDGTHSLVGFTPDPAAAAAEIARLRQYWKKGPFRPVCYRLVQVSQHDWRLHASRHGCASPDCPS